MLGEEAVGEPVHPDESIQLHDPRDVSGLEPEQRRESIPRNEFRKPM
jgi:hypothetical protein